MSEYTVLQPAHLGKGKESELLPTPECWYCGTPLERDDDGHIYGNYIGDNRYVCSDSQVCREQLCTLLGQQRGIIEEIKDNISPDRNHTAILKSAYKRSSISRDKWYKRSLELENAITAITALLDENGFQRRDLPVVDRVREFIQFNDNALESNTRLLIETNETDDELERWKKKYRTMYNICKEHEDTITSLYDRIEKYRRDHDILNQNQSASDLEDEIKRLRHDVECGLTKDYEISVLNRKVSTLNDEINRLRKCYLSATGHQIDDIQDDGWQCGEGGILRMECKEMSQLRSNLNSILAVLYSVDDFGHTVPYIMRRASAIIHEHAWKEGKTSHIAIALGEVSDRISDAMNDVDSTDSTNDTTNDTYDDGQLL